RARACLPLVYATDLPRIYTLSLHDALPISNPGATDFQTSTIRNFQGKEPEMVFEKVLRVSREWGTPENMMYVVGATQAEYLNRVDRKSTRLNSSHVKISYAVFCLKKKTPSA